MQTTANYGLKKPEGTDVVDIQNFNDNADTIDAELKKRVTTSDYIRSPGYAVDTGTANAYVVTLNPAPTAYVDGMAITVKIKTANTGASTLNVNSLGTKSILDSMGNALAAGKLKAGLPYTFRYNGTNFILQGEGGEYGTATQADVLNTATFGTEQGVKQGTMDLSNLTPENVRENVNINGVIGILKSQTDLVSKLSNNMRASSNYLISSIFSDDIWIMQLANGTIKAIQLDEEYNQIKTINLDTGIEYITDISYVYKRGNYIFTRPGAYGSSFMYDLNGNLIKTFATRYLVIIYCDEARNRLIVIDNGGLELRDSSNNILVNFNVSLDSKYILVIPYGNLLFVFTDDHHLVVYPDNTYKIIFSGMFFNE
ncbi:hypothetical protein [Clostridium sp.]|jgi:hypothetical protein|uniref:hypothetical protein n=1 Tax=Clostridium sp. TaxID=1506 RepID=UPI003A2C96A8